MVVALSGSVELSMGFVLYSTVPYNHPHATTTLMTLQPPSCWPAPATTPCPSSSRPAVGCARCTCGNRSTLMAATRYEADCCSCAALHSATRSDHAQHLTEFPLISPPRTRSPAARPAHGCRDTPGRSGRSTSPAATWTASPGSYCTMLRSWPWPEPSASKMPRSCGSGCRSSAPPGPA